MIVLEGTLWPVVFVGDAPAGDRPTDLVFLDEATLAYGDHLVLGLTIGGRGEAAIRAQRTILRWIRRHRPLLVGRVRRLAWIIADDGVRECVDQWLTLASSRICGGESATFARLQLAIPWLIAGVDEAPR